MSSKGIGKAFLSGLRVLGELQYIPASVRSDGKQIQQRTVIPCAINTGKQAADGSNISHTVRLTAWGKLADVMAKSCPPGKELHVVVDIRSYKGQVFFANGQPVMEADGSPVQVNKISFNIDELSFGNDSAAFIAKELERKARLEGWNIPGTPGHAHWNERKATIKALQYQPGMTTFGYAKVLAPRTGTPVSTNAGGDAAAVGAAFGGASATPGSFGKIPAGFTVDNAGNIVPQQAQPMAQANNSVTLF